MKVKYMLILGMCKLIPNCTGNFLPNEGHYSIAFNHIEEIIDSITL